MMIRTILTFSMLLFMSQLFIAQNNDSEQPKMKLNIEVNGEKYQVTDGGSIVVDGNTIKVASSDFLTFDFAAVTFDYPKHFAFEYETDLAYKNWTLDGNNFVILYFQYDIEIELDFFIDEIVGQFGKENCKVNKKKRQLGDITLEGKEIIVDIMGVSLTYEMFEIETEDSKTHFIAFQDTKNDDGSSSTESIETLKVIDQTIKAK
ncbi:hypothetical protein [uncultured Dokdonia sp.]|uniref:hypothetical protein n=1 Tax=uncultured Dokdonia sp. TaxID=575653 RepID=UPI00262BCCF6|nr:hypothetical protein [uncultured Dokdonia sp.]